METRDDETGRLFCLVFMSIGSFILAPFIGDAWPITVGAGIIFSVFALSAASLFFRQEEKDEP